MNSNVEETLLDLLYKKAVYGLNEQEEKQLAELQRSAGSDTDLESIEMTAAALSLADVDTAEPLPANLRARISADAERYFDEREAADGAAALAETEPQRKSFFELLPAWLGWAVAAAACIALAFNIYQTRTELARIRTAEPTPTPVREMTPEQMRERLIESAPDLARAEWSSPDKDNPDAVSGDIVWSDSRQAGYMRLRGLPVNDPSKGTYQLWIFDETQDPKTPIDGGTFDITAEGEVIIPINAKLEPRNPNMFAITVEKPGGVVVSTREKVAALAKRET